MFKFDQKEVTAKDFYGQRKITDVFAIDVNKVVVSNKVSYNNVKDWSLIRCHTMMERTGVIL